MSFYSNTTNQGLSGLTRIQGGSLMFQNSQGQTMHHYGSAGLTKTHSGSPGITQTHHEGTH